MLSARSPLSAKNEQTLVSGVRQLSLDKENTVSLKPGLCSLLSGGAEARRSTRPAGGAALTPFLFALLQPPSLSSSRVLASKTSRRIFAEPEVSEPPWSSGPTRPAFWSRSQMARWRRN